MLNTSTSKIPVKRRVNLLGQVVEKKKATASLKYEGGYVQAPVKGRHEYIVTQDFSSLYPSIMQVITLISLISLISLITLICQGYRVCYQRLIFDRDLLSDPDIECQYIPIDSLNCLVLAKSYKGEPVPTFLPGVMQGLCEQRTAVRKIMKGISKGGFEYNVLNSKQLACKVLANAAYGFLGVSTNGLFACPVITLITLISLISLISLTTLITPIRF